MPNLRQFAAVTKLAIEAAETVAPKIVEAAKSVDPALNFAKAMEETAAQAATRVARSDYFEQLVVNSCQKFPKLPGKPIRLLLSDGTQLESEYCPMNILSRTKEFQTPTGEYRSLTRRAVSKLKEGDVVAEGYPIDAVRDWHKLPANFPVRVLTKGKDITVDNLRYLGRDNFRLSLSNGKNLQREDFTIGGPFAKTKFASITPWNQLNLVKAWTLRQGETVGREFPFQWVKNDQYLTNGEWAFPRVRPAGAEWRHLPIEAVPERHWQGYLDGLHGKFMKEMIPLRTAITQTESSTATTVRALTPQQKELSALLKEGKMWDGAGSETISLSKDGSVIFEVSDTAGPSLYVVDKPGDFAIYLFQDYKGAEALASGQTARSFAMRKVPRVIHSGDTWKENLSQSLRKMRLQAAGQNVDLTATSFP